MAYKINPDRSKPFNDLPELPLNEEFYRDIDVLLQLGNSILYPTKGERCSRS